MWRRWLAVAAKKERDGKRRGGGMKICQPSSHTISGGKIKIVIIRYEQVNVVLGCTTPLSIV